MIKKTIIENEVNKFSKSAKDWWNPNGKYKVLHNFNNARLKFITNTLTNNNITIPNTINVNVLDVACGGGLLSEPLAKLGFNVTAIDASKNTIEIAKQHALQSNLSINYIHTFLEEYIVNYNYPQHPIILAMEIIEHVQNQQHFINLLLNSLPPNGLLFISSINKTLKALLLAKVAAEYILNWLPKNTHNFNRFISPTTIQSFLKNAKIINISGITFNITNRTWTLSKDTSVNYIMCIQKLS